MDYDCISFGLFVVSNDTLVIERYLNGCSCGIITVPCENFAGAPEKSHKKPQRVQRSDWVWNQAALE
jgi:hypothetical protein